MTSLVKYGADVPVEFYKTEAIAWGDERFKLIQRTIGNGANDEEMGLFIDLCNSFRLNPFAVGQIYLVPRSVKVPARGGEAERWETRYTVQIGIGGLRLLAERTGKLQGVIGPEWCGEDGNWRNVWLSDKPPAAARVAVCHRNYTQPRWAIALWREFSQWKRGYNGKPDELTQMWKQYPSYMLGKAAEAAALRGAFPAEMAGVPDVAMEADEQRGNRRQVIEEIVSDFTPTRPPAGRIPARASDLYPSDAVDGEVVGAPQPARPVTPPPVSEMDPEQLFWHTARELKYRTRREAKDFFFGSFEQTLEDAVRQVGWDEARRLLVKEHAAATAPAPDDLPFEDAAASGTPSPEDAFTIRASELGYADPDAARAEISRQYDGAPFAELVEQFGWPMLIDLLETAAEPPDPRQAAMPMAEAPAVRAASAKGSH